MAHAIQGDLLSDAHYCQLCDTNQNVGLYSRIARLERENRELRESLRNLEGRVQRGGKPSAIGVPGALFNP